MRENNKKKLLKNLIAILVLTLSFLVNAQHSNRFIIDSILVETKVHGKNFFIDKSEIHSVSYITNKNRIKHLGFYNTDSLTYILTNRYINRLDSLKGIPTTRKMTTDYSSWYYKNKPYNGPYINYYFNGIKKEEGFIKDGKVQGLVKYYYRDGSLSNLRNFINNSLAGIQTNYYSNGNRKSTIKYVEGKKNGEFVEYFPNEKIKRKGYYKNGTLNGIISEYYSNGSLKQKSNNQSEFESKNDELKYIQRLSDGHQIIEHVFGIEKLSKRKLRKINDCYYQFNALIKKEILLDDYYLSRGIIYLIKDDYELALNDFTHVLNIEPLNYAAKYYGVLTLLKKYKNTALENIPIEDRIVICSSLSNRINDSTHRLHEIILTEYYKYCPN
ncbi:hypothetical protein A9Q86_10465 [Flavobacteriales bacterium 33_180_T64]|nr:hypothetical protein A9Q86_10465 [Flavobacteriales bacterium 33_180_T64]